MLITKAIIRKKKEKFLDKIIFVHAIRNNGKSGFL